VQSGTNTRRFQISAGFKDNAGCSGLVVICLTAAHEIPGSDRTVGSLCVCQKKQCGIISA